MNIENSIKDVISQKLEDGTIEKSVGEQLEKGVTAALENLFRSYGDVTKIIEEKVRSVWVPSNCKAKSREGTRGNKEGGKVMKKYKGWEIAKLISEGKLEGKKIELFDGDVGGNRPYMVSKSAMWDIEFEREIGNSLLTNVYDEYIIPQEPVSFMDCVASEGWVRVEHELTNKIIVNGRYYKEFKNGECIPFEHLMYYLSSELDNEELRTVINEGKWYLEEAEDGEVQDL